MAAGLLAFTPLNYFTRRDAPMLHIHFEAHSYLLLAKSSLRSVLRLTRAPERY